MDREQLGLTAQRIAQHRVWELRETRAFAAALYATPNAA
jgi:hypothetical protein